MTPSRKHKCRRSCPTQIPREKAFCHDCWPKIPRLVRRAILSSWQRVQDDKGNLEVYGAHVELLMATEEALEGDREWESVA